MSMFPCNKGVETLAKENTSRKEGVDNVFS